MSRDEALTAAKAREARETRWLFLMSAAEETVQQAARFVPVLSVRIKDGGPRATHILVTVGAWLPEWPVEGKLAIFVSDDEARQEPIRSFLVLRKPR